MSNEKEVIDFFQNLNFGKCFENLYASRKNEKIRVFLGMITNKEGKIIGVSSCSPRIKQPVAISSMLKHICPQKTHEVPIYTDLEYENFFHKALRV